MADEILSKNSIYEQYWGQAKHLESERMWIMGIWLGVTGFMLNEIWGASDTTSLDVQSVGSMSSAHLILTLAVLAFISKLNLEYSRYVELIRKKAKDHTEENDLKGLWAIIVREKIGENWIRKTFRRILNTILTIGGVSSGILIFGIVLDVVLMTRRTIGDRFICGFPHWTIFLLSWGIAFAVYQGLFYIPIYNKLIDNLKSKPGTKGDHSSSGF